MWSCLCLYREGSTGKVKGKVTLVQAQRLCTGRTAHRGSRDIALPFHGHGTTRRWGVSITPQLLFTPPERPGTHCTGGWVGPRAGVDRCRRSCPHQNSTVQPVASRYTDYVTRPTSTGSRVVIPVINPDTRWRWMVNFTPWSLYPHRKSLWYALNRRLGGVQQELVWTFWRRGNLLPLLEIETQIMKDISWSLYWLLCAGCTH